MSQPDKNEIEWKDIGDDIPEEDEVLLDRALAKVFAERAKMSPEERAKLEKEEDEFLKHKSVPMKLW